MFLIVVKVGFLREDYYIMNKNDIHGPEIRVYGMAAFPFNVSILETAGTATGKLFIVYEYILL